MKSARIQDEKGLIFRVYENDKINLPYGVYYILDPLPPNCSITGSGSRTKLILKEESQTE